MIKPHKQGMFYPTQTSYFYRMNNENDKKEITPADLFLNTLRRATEPMHRGLENNSIAQRLMSPSVSLSEYAFYLNCMGEVIKAFDDKVLPAIAAAIVDADSRRKYHEIKADLDFLYSNGATVATVKPFVGFTGKPSMAYALGYAYVIEGSTLGGRVILKQVMPSLHLEEDGTRFFAGYGADTGKYWKAFLQQFCAYILSNNAQEVAIQGAQDAFTEIGQHFKNQE